MLKFAVMVYYTMLDSFSALADTEGVGCFKTLPTINDAHCALCGLKAKSSMGFTAGWHCPGAFKTILVPKCKRGDRHGSFQGPTQIGYCQYKLAASIAPCVLQCCAWSLGFSYTCILHPTLVVKHNMHDLKN